MFGPSLPSSDQHAAQLLEMMPVGFILWDAQWLCVGVNVEGERLCGKRAAELFGRSLWELFPDVVGTEFETIYRRVARTGCEEQLEFYYADPLNRWFEIHACAQEGGVAAYYIDVTPRHELQDQLDRAAAHDRAVAHTLQNVLLPTLPAIEGVALAARYLTAQDSDQVGGDWYDVLPGRGGTVSLLIGDVAGHDITAAATMGQLRSMLRMNAWDHADDDPSQLVARLDRAARDLGIRTTASLALVQIGPPALASRTRRAGTRPVLLANAGHPPPIVVHPDGRTQLLNGIRADVLLGVTPRAVRQDHRFEIPCGSTVVLYTDGLIETRTHDVDHGIERLRAALTRHLHDDLEQLVDSVIAELVGDQPSDDVAVIAGRLDC